MAAATTILMGGAALAGSGLQIAQGLKQTKEGEAALNDFERQELQNIFEDMPISLLGSNIRREDTSQMNANLTDAARNSGIRGVFGALPRIQAMGNQAARQNQLDVDNQVMKRNYAIAGDEGRIQGMQENRDNQDLAGIGQQIAVGQQNTMSGIGSAFNSLGFISGMMGKSAEETDEPTENNQGFLPVQFRNNYRGMDNPIPTGSPTPGIGQPSDWDKYLEMEEGRRWLNEVDQKNFGRF
jgi:hypothetical protein